MLFFIRVAPTIETRFGLSRSLPAHSNCIFCIMHYFVDYLLILIVYCTVKYLYISSVFV